jgi:4-hydroxyphenylpyruvate dioxygenase
MKIDRVCFYVEDATQTSNWFIDNLGFQKIASYLDIHTQTEVIANNSIYLVFASPLNYSSPVASYLNCRAPGVADIVFRVTNLESIVSRAKQINVPILQPLQFQGKIKWAKIQGWDALQHTLIEFPLREHYPFLPELKLWQASSLMEASEDFAIDAIDHIVLNVAAGELASAVARYQELFGWEIQQTFAISTKHSGLYSQALIDTSRQVQFNINEPTAANSQIQEFLEFNGGAGIQHLALRSHNILHTVTQMRSRGVIFLDIPPSYYQQVKQRSNLLLQDWEWQTIAESQILVDRQESPPESLLMQIFTQPIFNKPTFFLELIERRQQARGFGEGNFQALFEAVEREQKSCNS